jgi:hypothetical protein
MKGLLGAFRNSEDTISLQYNGFCQQSTENFCPTIVLLLRKNTTSQSEK